LDTLQTRDKVNEIEPDINVVLWKNERQGDDALEESKNRRRGEL